MLTALVVWTTVFVTTVLGIVWAEHAHPERYTQAAVARRFAFLDDIAEADSEESE